MRGSVSSVLRKAKPPPPNLEKDERAALKSLREDKTIKVLPADKGNATVVMDATQYEEKIRDLLTDPIYRKVKRDPTAATERKVLEEVRRLEKKKLIPQALAMKLKPTASRPPKLYGLPKVHKPTIPLRPIVSCIGAPTYQLSKFITSLISPLAGQTSSFIKNSQHFVESIKDLQLQPTEVMVSFDIKSLFTNVPVKEALEVIMQRLSDDDTLEDRTALSVDQVTHLLDLCLRTTYFMYQGEFYQQRDGAAMGSPVSPVVANIYMEMFEDLALRTELAPRIWRRYVDDTFCVMEKEHSEAFLDHLNTLRPTIQFTMELEMDRSLPFLDTLLTRREDGSINIGVYRKMTHTDRYLHYSSHHPEHMKRGVASCLFHRARTVAVGENIKKEERHLAGVLEENGYPDHIIRLAAAPRREKQPEEEPKHTICLPYVAGVSEDLRRICRRFDIRTVFTTIATLRQQLTRVKDVDPFLSTAGVVYRIPCSNCDKVYIGETRRALGTRLKEHQANTRRGEVEKSAVAEHAWGEEHRPAWDETSILKRARKRNY